MFSENEIEEGKKLTASSELRGKVTLSFRSFGKRSGGLPVQAAQCFTKPHS